MSSWKTLGDDLWKKIDKVNTELFALLYGSLVASLVKEYPGDMRYINTQLDKMGYQIGVRLVEDFLARSGIITKCITFQDTTEVLRAAVKMFLGVYPVIISWSSDGKECIMALEENPLIEWVDLSQDIYSKNTMTCELRDYNDTSESSSTSDVNPLCYCQLYCGMIRGALEMVQVQVNCTICQDPLLDSKTENSEKAMHKKATHFKLSLIKFLGETAPLEDDINM